MLAEGFKLLTVAYKTTEQIIDHFTTDAIQMQDVWVEIRTSECVRLTQGIERLTIICASDRSCNGDHERGDASA